MTPPLSPERLTQLLDDAVRPVTARPGAFDRIRQGTRRPRPARRAGVLVLAGTVIAAGAVTALIVVPGGGPARIASPPASGPVFSTAAKTTPGVGQTPTTALPTADQQAVPTAARSPLPSFTASTPSASQPVVATPGASASPSASQRVVTGTLATLAKLAREASLRGPTVIIVGSVVTLREKLAWFRREAFGSTNDG